MPEGQVLEFSRVTKRFGAVTAVSDLSVRVEPGLVTGFLGPNGAGKTTSLRILLGQIRPTSGTATIGGQSYSELRHPLRTIGAVLEEAAYRPRRTASRQLMTAAKANGIPSSRVDEVLRLVGLQDDADTRLGSYSLGMRQRLTVAMALLGDPGVLVLDEPANGLDPEGIRWMRLLMRRLADEGRTVLVSSHVLSEIEQVADNVVVLSKGQAVYSGPISDLASPAGGAVIVDAANRAPLITALAAANLEFDVLRSGVTVRNSDSATVGAVTAAAGVPLTMLQQRGPSLEEVFLDLVYGRRADSPRLDEVANPVAHAPLTPETSESTRADAALVAGAAPLAGAAAVVAAAGSDTGPDADAGSDAATAPDTAADATGAAADAAGDARGASGAPAPDADGEPIADGVPAADAGTDRAPAPWTPAAVAPDDATDSQVVPDSGTASGTDVAGALRTTAGSVPEMTPAGQAQAAAEGGPQEHSDSLGEPEHDDHDEPEHDEPAPTSHRSHDAQAERMAAAVAALWAPRDADGSAEASDPALQDEAPASALDVNLDRDADDDAPDAERPRILPLATEAVTLPTSSELPTFTSLITGLPATIGDGEDAPATEAIPVFTPHVAHDDDEDAVVDDADDDPRLAAMRTSLSSAASRFFHGEAPDYPYGSEPASGEEKPQQDAARQNDPAERSEDGDRPQAG